MSKIKAQKTAVIAISESDSAEVDLGGYDLCGITMPAAFTGTAISFKVATASGGTFNVVHDGGSLLSETASASKYIVLDPNQFKGVQYLKVVSNGTEVAERTLTLHYRYIS